MIRFSLLSRIVDIVSPRSCPVCGQRLTISEDPMCAVCSMRLPRTGFAEYPLDNEMVRLLWGIIKVERGAALFYYTPESDVARVVLAAKYGQNPQLCESLGRMMAEDMMQTGFFDGIDLLVPVPLSRGRKRHRGYNQSEMMACGISGVTHIPVERRAVHRRLFQDSQTTKSRRERRENVRNAFQLVAPERIAGRHLLLIDDVMTTGSTVCSCAAELLKAPDVKISVLTLGFTKN